MTARLAGVFLMIAALAGCVGAGYPEGKYALGADTENPAAADPLLVGHRLMDAGEYELAHRAYTRAGAAQGLTADVLAGLGSANLALGRLGTAERLLRRAVGHDDATPEMWNNLGVVLVEKGEFLEAEQMLPTRSTTVKVTRFATTCVWLSQKRRIPAMIPTPSKTTKWCGAAAANTSCARHPDEAEAVKGRKNAPFHPDHPVRGRRICPVRLRADPRRRG
jgi:tetratricopeptide (TPR) repeat protein